MPADFTDNDAPATKRKSWKRPALVFLALFAAWIGGMLLYDEKLEPFEDLIPPASRNTDARTNGYLFLKERYFNLPNWKLPKNWNDMVHGRIPMDEALLAQHRAGRGNAAADLATAVAMPDWEVPVVLPPLVSEPRAWMVNLCRGLATEAIFAQRNGDFAAALDILRHVHLAAGRQLECGGDFMTFWIALTIQSFAAELCCDMLEHGGYNESRQNAMAQLWDSEPAAAAAWKNVLRWQRSLLEWQLKHLLSDAPYEDYEDDSSGRLGRFFIKQNATLNRYHRRLRSLMRTAFQPFLSLRDAEAAGLAEMDKPVGKWSRWADPNWRGLVTLQDLNPLVKVSKTVRKALFVPRAMKVRLALQRWRQEHPDHWPATLEELVPQYLPAIPADPWTGKPLSWDEPSRTIYAAGSDWKSELPTASPLQRWQVGETTSPGLRMEIPAVAGTAP